MIWMVLGSVFYVAVLLLTWSLCKASAYGQSIEYSPDKPIDTGTEGC